MLDVRDAQLGSDDHTLLPDWLPQLLEDISWLHVHAGVVFEEAPLDGELLVVHRGCVGVRNGCHLLLEGQRALDLVCTLRPVLHSCIHFDLGLPDTRVPKIPSEPGKV